MNKKFELTTDTKMFLGRKLFRIKALISFGDVKEGDLGGYVEKESNLSHNDDAWVYDDAQVCGDACVYDNARVCGNAWVYGDACVYDNARVYGDARVCGDACVYDNARVYGDARVCGDAWVYGDACVYDNARVYGDARVCGDARVYGNAQVCGDAWVYGDARVCDNACVCGNACVYGDARVCDNADYLCFKGLGSKNRNTTFFKCKDGRIHVSCGCFSGNLTEFEQQVKKTHEDSKFAKEYLAAIEVVKIHFELEEE